MHEFAGGRPLVRRLSCTVIEIVIDNILKLAFRIQCLPNCHTLDVEDDSHCVILLIRSVMTSGPQAAIIVQYNFYVDTCRSARWQLRPEAISSAPLISSHLPPPLLPSPTPSPRSSQCPGHRPCRQIDGQTTTYLRHNYRHHPDD